MIANGLNLSHEQRLAQTMTPQMRQSLKLLQLPIFELRAELMRQMELNPVIEDVESRADRMVSEVAREEHNNDSPADHELVCGRYETLAADDGYRDYYLGNLQSATGDEEAVSKRQYLFDSQVKTETLQDHLLAQVPMLEIDESKQRLVEQLIHYVNDDGYFEGSFPDLMMLTGATQKELEALLPVIGGLDPIGCGGRNLRECLLFQMEKLEDSPWEDEVRAIVSRFLPDVAARRERKICEALKLTPEEYHKARAVLVTLDPKPGRKFVSNGHRPEYVIPEVEVVRGRDGLIATVRSRELPEIKISRRYETMLRDSTVTAEAKAYIRERIRAANSLREAVERRQETIRLIAQTIVDAQPGFFKEGFTALKPLKMIDVAKIVGVHEATVSRTVNGKYMRTPKGVVEMRKFFTSGIATSDGSEMSNRSIQERIRAIIASEDPAAPFSDDVIAAKIKAEGINIARRTVAKYRDAIKIPSARDRRRS